MKRVALAKAVGFQAPKSLSYSYHTACACWVSMYSRTAQIFPPRNSTTKLFSLL